MKRIQDKIKDLVEPQSFEQVGNLAEDPTQALAAYRFTDVTSDLLSRWLDAIADLRAGQGAARALAGPRGVGKSHTLAVLWALAGSERLRSTVDDSHVAASAARLSGHRFAVVRVERGTRPTLAQELAAAFAAFFGGSESQWGREPAEVLTVAASRATGETLVVIIDTAFNRPARVARDDGPVLASLATAAQDLNVFLALALDDDIADADGANVAVAGTYRIDYLDPENLYRVADQFVLRKKPQVGDTLREIYQSLRATVHEFNWSQARFSSVYPVHPLVAEVASGVRLFVPTFAFLPFAARAAARATARPALSLVLLDEVFDATEAELREAAELRRAFAAYDHLTERCIAQLPIMQRYQARLVLKSLFVLSLDGRDVTPGEMCAALLMTDGEAGEDAPRRVSEILARFATESAPGSLVLADGPGGETRYRFQIGEREAHAASPDSKAEPKAASAAETKTASAFETQQASEAGREVAAGSSANDETSFGSLALEVDRHVAGAGSPSEKSARPSEERAAKVLDERETKAKVEGPSGLQTQPSGLQPTPSSLQSQPSKLQSQPLSVQTLSEESVEWARLLTGNPSLGSSGVSDDVRAALAEWLEGWRTRGLRRKFDALPDAALTTRAWKVESEVSRSFGRAASALEATLAGNLTLAEALSRVAEAFRHSHETFARRSLALEDLQAFVEGFAARERSVAYLAAAEATGIDEIETARRELLSIAEDRNSFLEAERRERFDRLWREFRARYCEHYAAVHDKTVGAREARELIGSLRRSERWREFESLSRLPVVSSQVWRQAEGLLRLAESGRCDVPVRRILESQPTCACHFRLARAAELEELPQELEALMERGLAVYRRTLLMLGASLAISLDALARRDEDEASASRARTLSAALAQGQVPSRLTRQEVQAIESALRRMPAPPPVKVVAPNGDAGLLTRDELRARFEQWIDELPEQPVLIEVVSKAEIRAT